MPVPACPAQLSSLYMALGYSGGGDRADSIPGQKRAGRSRMGG